MKNVKLGYIVQILENENLGIIREDRTLTEWLFFLDDLTEGQINLLQVGQAVTFRPNWNYDQFVVQNLEVQPQYKMAV